MSPHTWPYPFWIAHRGAGTTAPENTLAAVRSGFEAGFRMFECDVKLSHDGQAFLLHDDTLERTTNGTGLAHLQSWSALQSLDAGSWHSPCYAGEPLATLAQVSRFCQANQCLVNLELKPSLGCEALTGERVAQDVRTLWTNSAELPLLTSFSLPALLAARQAAPELTRGLLIEEVHTSWSDDMHAAQCRALICDYRHINAELVAQVHAQGGYCLAYTVNDPWTAGDLIRIGIDGIITDQLDLPAYMQVKSSAGQEK